MGILVHGVISLLAFPQRRSVLRDSATVFKTEIVRTVGTLNVKLSPNANVTEPTIEIVEKVKRNACGSEQNSTLSEKKSVKLAIKNGESQKSCDRYSHEYRSQESKT
jgi:hypothetical protein